MNSLIIKYNSDIDKNDIIPYTKLTNIRDKYNLTFFFMDGLDVYYRDKYNDNTAVYDPKNNYICFINKPDFFNLLKNINLTFKIIHNKNIIITIEHNNYMILIDHKIIRFIIAHQIDCMIHRIYYFIL